MFDALIMGDLSFEEKNKNHRAGSLTGPVVFAPRIYNTLIHSRQCFSLFVLLNGSVL